MTINSEFSDNNGNDKKKLTKREFVEEYRLVPIEESYQDEDEELIDIIGILKDLWLNKKTIYIVTGLVLMLGILIYFTSERIYYSETTLMPESTSGRSQIGQVFQQYESIFGLQRLPEEDDIRVAIYPDIVSSLPFLVELMQHEVYFSSIERRVTVFEYFTVYYEKSWIDRFGEALFKYTIGLPVTIWDWIQSSGSDTHTESFSAIDLSEFINFDQPKMLHSEVRNVASVLSEFITVIREPQTGFISIGVALPDARGSTEMVMIVKNLLQEYVIDYRTEKALIDLEFIKERYQEARTNLLVIQDSLAAFQDRNINVTSRAIILQEERLQTERDLAFSLYSTLARRLQEAEIQVQKETPIFRVHEPATIPSRPAQPRASRIIGGSVFLGIFFGILSIYLRRLYKRFRIEFVNKEPKPYLS